MAVLPAGAAAAAARRIGAALPPLLVLLVFGSACRELGPRAEEPILFGLAAPLDESYGESTRLGAELAVNQINAGDGIDGRPLGLKPVNDYADRERAIPASQELVSDPRVVAVVGHVNSSTTVAAARSYQGRVPAIATSATSPQISTLGPWIFRIASSDSANGIALARFATRISERPAILYANDEYGRGLATSFAAGLRAEGSSPIASDPYTEESPRFQPYLERMQRRGVDLIFLAGLETGAAEAIRAARALGLDVRFIGGDGVEGLRDRGGDFGGTYVGLLFHPDANPRAREFAAAYRAAYGREPDSFAATAYDAVMLLARAAEQVGPDPAQIRDYLDAVGRPGGSPAFAGVTGEIRFDESGDPLEKTFDVGVIGDGTIRLAGSQG
ncbi:ABC transporter substrate-binding protein [soil metagenome]